MAFSQAQRDRLTFVTSETVNEVLKTTTACNSREGRFKFVSSVLHAAADIVNEALAKLAKHENSRPSAAAMPQELLCDVFSRLAFEDKVLASHVCYSWRHASLNSASLWTTIVADAYFHDMVEELLSRCNGAPVKLSLHWHGLTDIRRLTNLVSSHLSHIQDLELVGLPYSSDEYGVVLLSALATPAPILTTFCLRPAPAPALCRPSGNIFAGHAPRLQHLSLGNTLSAVSGCGALSTASEMPNITHLIIEASTSAIVGDAMDIPNLKHLHVLAAPGDFHEDVLRFLNHAKVQYVNIYKPSSNGTDLVLDGIGPVDEAVVESAADSVTHIVNVLVNAKCGYIRRFCEVSPGPITVSLLHGLCNDLVHLTWPEQLWWYISHLATTHEMPALARLTIRLTCSAERAYRPDSDRSIFQLRPDAPYWSMPRLRYLIFTTFDSQLYADRLHASERETKRCVFDTQKLSVSPRDVAHFARHHLRVAAPLHLILSGVDLQECSGSPAYEDLMTVFSDVQEIDARHAPYCDLGHELGRSIE